jgi:hypothetical protein
MKYARHFLATFLIFIVILLIVIFIDNQPFGVGSRLALQYYRPVTVDVCNQTIARSWNGQYESQGCNQAVNHDANYYYYGTVNSPTGEYVPYVR